MTNHLLTKNFQKLKAEVIDHVAADRVAQGSYKTCFIGCLANGINNPKGIECKYGIPAMVTRIAESIFEGLPEDEAEGFFAEIPQAIASDGKDLTRVGWKFLAAELRALPPVSDDIQACIGPVIEGMDLLGEGEEWPKAAAWSHAADGCDDAACSSKKPAWSAGRAAIHAATSAWSAATWSVIAWSADAEIASSWASEATLFAANAANSGAFAASRHRIEALASGQFQPGLAHTTRADTRLRQRDTLLRLIKEAPTE